METNKTDVFHQTHECRYRSAVNTYVWFWMPMTDRWLRRDRCTLFDERAILNRQIGNVSGYNFARLLCPCHCRSNHFVQWNFQFFQTFTGEGGLFATHFGQISVSIGGPVQIVLSVSNENQMANGCRFHLFQFFVELIFVGRRRAGF